MRFSSLLPIFFLFFLTACSISMNPNSDEGESMHGCLHDEKLQTDRSTELQKIVDLDQKSRADFLHFSKEQMLALYNQDVENRKRVGEIFGEGCFKTAKDFSNAALVFQHGTSADHFYQAYVWSKRAVQLGDLTKKEFMANAIDRYLVTIGQRQLFASQAHVDSQNQCYCMQEVEPSFSDKKRQEYKGKTLAESMKWIDVLNTGKSCAPAKSCLESLKTPEPGQFPGIW